MTKSELTTKLAEKFNLPPQNARIIVDLFFENILRALILEEKLILRGFGSFMIKVSHPRQRRNPKTGDTFQMGERRSLVFKAGKALLTRLNRARNDE